MNKYQRGKEAARAAAQDWQAAFSRSAMSWGELAISIHALRGEGDSRNTQKYFCKFIIFHKFF